jgi:hypothetical protein
VVLNHTNNVQICYVIAPNFPLHNIYPMQMDFDLPNIRIETTNRNRELVISARRNPNPKSPPLQTPNASDGWKILTHQGRGRVRIVQNSLDSAPTFVLASQQPAMAATATTHQDRPWRSRLQRLRRLHR